MRALWHDRVDNMGLFRKKMKQEHKVMLQHDRTAGALQPEYHRATPECPEPARWRHCRAASGYHR